MYLRIVWDSNEMKTAFLAFVLFLSICLMPLAIGHETGEEHEHDFPDSELEELNKDAGKKLPMPMRIILKNERISLEVDNGEIIATFIIEKGIFKGASREAIENPTIKLVVPKDVYDQAKGSENPGRGLIEAYRDGKVKKELVGGARKLKMKLLGFALSKFNGK